MPHVELSLTEDASRFGPASAVRPRARAVADAPTAIAHYSTSLERWAAAAACADEPCLVLRTDAVIVAASTSCAELIGLGEPAAAYGRSLRDAVVNLVDFTDPPAQLDSGEADKIPPLLAIASGQLARGLMRVACPISRTACMMDAIATPLWDNGVVTGSLTFFSKI